ncbi:MAG: hypothetical protein AMK73_03330 [Planctomycetes bacterium SM23_32]|nr:MAG: hypothetical protein AMK73_03330 [Planctomycetes bacterium SM23_32]
MIHLLWLSLAVPVLIHLVHRRKATQVPFSTLRFLRMVDRRVARHHRLKELLLLALRMLLLAALVGALYRPMVRSATFKGANVPTTAAIVLDNTYSMRAASGGALRFGRAKAAAMDVLDGLQRGDAALVALFDAPADSPAEPTTALSRLRDELNSMECGYGTAGAAGAIRRALDALKAGVNPRRELYVITDFQKLSWAPGPATDAAAALEELRGALPADVPVFLVDVGGDVDTNLALTSAEFGLNVQVTGAACELYCSLENTGRLNADQRLALHLDGEKVAERDASLAAGGRTTVSFSHVFARTGTVSGAALLEPDDLAADNARYFVVNVHEKLPVLLVNGDPSSVPHLNETFFLELALGAPSAGGRSVSPVEAKVVTPADLARLRLDDYACIVMANVSSVPELTADGLRRYVLGGGGLVLFVGDRVDPASYNTVLAPVGADPLLPALLTEVTEHPAAGEGESGAGYRLRSMARQHPIFRNIAEQMETDAARVGRFFAVKACPGEALPPALMALEEGPLLLERRAGAGVVLLCTTSADLGWGNLPARRFFLPWLHQMVYHAARSLGRREALTPGSPFVLDLPAEAGAAEVAFYGPPSGEGEHGEPLATLTAEPADGGHRVTFRQTASPGVYRAIYRSGNRPQTRLFAVNVDTAESDLTRIEPERAAELLGAAAVKVVDNPARLAQVVRREREGLPLWDHLFVLAVALALLETYVANVALEKRR